jgi:hypothetical protein
LAVAERFGEYGLRGVTKLRKHKLPKKAELAFDSFSQQCLENLALRAEVQQAYKITGL